MRISRHIFLIGLICIPLSVDAYSLIQKKIDGHSVRIFHIPHDDSYRVTAVASLTGTNLRSLIESAGGVAGMNGAYFTPRDYSGKPDETSTVRIMGGDGFRYSRFFPDTGINGIFGFQDDGTPLLVQNNIYADKALRMNYSSHMILELESGIANYPILLASGANILPRYESLGLITEKMRIISMKSFICRTASDDIKMGTISSISLIDVPAFLMRISCIDAINLDNGGSTALYDKKRYIIGPGRNIMDGYVIVKK